MSVNVENLTFSQQVKDELIGVQFENDCCKYAEIAGLLQAGGSIQLLGGGGYGLLFSTEHENVIMRLASLLQECYRLEPQMFARKRRRLGREERYQLALGRSEITMQILQQTGWLVSEPDGGYSFGGVVPSALVRKECCRRAYMRGAFLASGTISDPDKGYDMEFLAQSEAYAQSLLRLLNRRGGGAHIAERRQLQVVYVKEGDSVADCLAAMGAMTSMLRLEEARIVRGIRNDTNRRVNCENANIDKTVNAAARQLEDIALIERELGFATLSVQLREMAETRMEYPDATLQELADLLPGNVSKSAVNHRMRRIAQIARELRGNDPLEE